MNLPSDNLSCQKGGSQYFCPSVRRKMIAMGKESSTAEIVTAIQKNFKLCQLAGGGS